MSAIRAKRNLVEDRLSSPARAFNRSLPQKRQRTEHRQFQNPNPNAQVAYNCVAKGYAANCGVDPIQPIARQRPPPPTSQIKTPVQPRPMSGSDLLRMHSSITNQREAPKQDTVWSSPYVTSQFMSDSYSVPLQIPHSNSACKSGTQVQMQNSFSSSVNLHVKAPILSFAPPTLVSDSFARPANVPSPAISPYVLSQSIYNSTPISVQIPNVSCVYKPQIPVPIQNSATSYLNLNDKDWNLSQSVSNIVPANALLELINFTGGGKTQSPPVEDDKVPSDFDPVWLKGRHESVISSLYCEIPRQCSSCGVRFKTQEEHSKHMDWHVQKNRARRSTKIKPSRSYFPTASMWVDDNETAPPAVMSNLRQVEKEEEDVEPAVPIDDDQMFCALCQERFEEIFSDVTDEYMFRGAVFMKAPGGWKPGMETSLLGPIVHAKCLS